MPHFTSQPWSRLTSAVSGSSSVFALGAAFGFAGAFSFLPFAAGAFFFFLGSSSMTLDRSLSDTSPFVSAFFAGSGSASLSSSTAAPGLDVGFGESSSSESSVTVFFPRRTNFLGGSLSASDISAGGSESSASDSSDSVFARFLGFLAGAAALRLVPLAFSVAALVFFSAGFALGLGAAFLGVGCGEGSSEQNFSYIFLVPGQELEVGLLTTASTMTFCDFSFHVESVLKKPSSRASSFSARARTRFTVRSSLFPDLWIAMTMSRSLFEMYASEGWAASESDMMGGAFVAGVDDRRPYAIDAAVRAGTSPVAHT